VQPCPGEGVRRVGKEHLSRGLPGDTATEVLPEGNATPRVELAGVKATLRLALPVVKATVRLTLPGVNVERGVGLTYVKAIQAWDFQETRPDQDTRDPGGRKD